MTRATLRSIIGTAPIYKMSLGKSARFRAEALEHGVLVFESETEFHAAVLAGNHEEIERTGRLVKSETYPNGNAPPGAWGVWRRSIETFRALADNCLILHWESDTDHVHWGITSGKYSIARSDFNDFSQPSLIFHRPLIDGWKRLSINGVPLSNLHPKARDLAINMATLNEIQTYPDFFRALLVDAHTDAWTRLPDWQKKATEKGWHPKDIRKIRAARRKPTETAYVSEIADHFEADIKRMAATAIATAEYANGQTVLTTVKAKDIGFCREELQDEIADLLSEQSYKCALTDYDFRRSSNNTHLKPSLDRKNSSLGYVADNLQIVTRAANFFKSASDDQDWRAKREALEKMAMAIQQQRKASLRP